MITILFLLLGLRVSELVSIDLSHINHDDGTLTIIGKGRKKENWPLRHTCATVLYNNGEGADLLALAELLGHADPKTTTIYTKINVEKMRTIVTTNPLELT